jgi:hypothetical protein
MEKQHIISSQKQEGDLDTLANKLTKTQNRGNRIKLDVGGQIFATSALLLHKKAHTLKPCSLEDGKQNQKMMVAIS